MAVIDFFDRGWSMAPEAVAYRTDDEAWTYEQAGRMSCRIAHALASSGAARDIKVAVISPNQPVAWICVLGIWRAGATWVPLNPAMPVEDTVTLLDRFDVEVLFYDPTLADQIEQVRVGNPGIRLVALSPGTDHIDLANWVRGHPETKPDVTYVMDDVIAIAPTGGTTGLPKGVMNTHRSYSAMVAHHMLAMAYAPGERIVNLAAAPMTHTSGMLTLQTTARGGEVVIVPRCTVDHILPAIEEYGVTDLFLPPTVIYRMLDVLARQDYDTSSLRYLLYGAAPMSVEKLRSGIARLGHVFIECYGQMEAPAAIAFMRPEEHLVDGEVASDDRLASCGRPYPLIEVQIKDPVSGSPLGTGETGEICVRGDLVMKGYYKDPERTAEVIRDGWLHTGDLGNLDGDGYLHVTDRTKDVIITGGFNVYPGEIEQVIWSHPAVEDCAVVGAPDEDWGERVTAVVETKPGRSVSAEDLIDLCRTSLGGVRTPKTVIFIDRLPRSANGKVLKKDVRSQFWATTCRAI